MTITAEARRATYEIVENALKAGPDKVTDPQIVATVIKDLRSRTFEDGGEGIPKYYENEEAIRTWKAREAVLAAPQR